MGFCRLLHLKKSLNKSSPAKKGDKSSKRSSPNQQVAPVHESYAYFIIKTNKGKGKECPLSNIQISLIKFKESILYKELLKSSYKDLDFLH